MRQIVIQEKKDEDGEKYLTVDSEDDWHEALRRGRWIETPLQLAEQIGVVPAVGGSVRFAQEVDRHRCPEKGIVFGERIGTDPMLLLWTESVHNISQRPFR